MAPTRGRRFLFGAVCLLLIMPYPPVANAQTNPYGPQVTFRTENVLPPAAVYVGPQDSIFVNLLSPSLAAPVSVTYRLLTPQGQIITSVQTVTTTSGAGGGAQLIIPPAEGYLLSLTVQCPSAVRGQMFVQAYLLAGTTSASGTIDQLLLQGYAAGYDGIAYPQSIPESSTSGRGWVHSVFISQPAADTDWQTTVPAGVRWVLKAAQNAFATSAVVANRSPMLTFLTPGFLSVGWMPCGTILTANLPTDITWFDGALVMNIGNFLTGPLLRDFVLGPGYIIKSQTLNMAAGDQWGAAVLFVEEWVSQD